MKTALEILVAARELISDPAKWAKGFYSYKVPSTELKYRFTSTGVFDWSDEINEQRCYERSDEAKCFCSVGAIGKVAGFGEVVEHACDVLRKLVPDEDIVRFNDHRDTTHDMVLAKFDAAIAAARLQ